MSNLSFGDLEADYVLTDEERAASLSDESMEETRQRVKEAEIQQQAVEAQRQAAEQAAADPLVEQASTEATPPQQQAPSTSTGVPFDPSKDYSYYAAQGMSRKEWNRLQFGGGVSSEMRGLSEDPKSAIELATAVPTGFLDFGTDLVNQALKPSQIQVPKLTKYENGIAQTVRDIAAVVGPTMSLQNLLKRGAMNIHGRVGWRLGNTAFMRFLGNRGVEAGTSVAIGSVASQYEEGDNMMGALKKALPAQWDFIPDNWATLDINSPDEKRQKSINEDLALGFLIPFVRSVGRFGEAIGDVKRVFSEPPVIKGNTPKAEAWSVSYTHLRAHET